MTKQLGDNFLHPLKILDQKAQTLPNTWCWFQSEMHFNCLHAFADLTKTYSPGMGRLQAVFLQLHHAVACHTLPITGLLGLYCYPGILWLLILYCNHYKVCVLQKCYKLSCFRRRIGAPSCSLLTGVTYLSLLTEVLYYKGREMRAIEQQYYHTQEIIG